MLISNEVFKAMNLYSIYIKNFVYAVPNKQTSESKDIYASDLLHSQGIINSVYDSLASLCGQNAEDTHIGFQVGNTVAKCILGFNKKTSVLLYN